MKYFHLFLDVIFPSVASCLMKGMSSWMYDTRSLSKRWKSWVRRCTDSQISDIIFLAFTDGDNNGQPPRYILMFMSFIINSECHHKIALCKKCERSFQARNP
jgi:hypothetical protein